ncbi:zinc-binding dehydrogenase [Nocardia fluminea]|uniref:zinc-binding dehydrogenase n=1 Tax=Nocardia fluminea TaxID=134984 RepID=UPI003661BF11
MRAIRLTATDPTNPLSGVTIGEGHEPRAPDQWAKVTMKAASVNAADFAVMRGAAARSVAPIVLGSDGAGIDDQGNEVIIYPILNDSVSHHDPMHDPNLRMLSQGVDGTFATALRVPRANLIPKPPQLSWEVAACLGTAWLTAYRMLFIRARVLPGETVLVRGAGGGVATALIQLATTAGIRVWVTSRDTVRRQRAVTELGADNAFAPDALLPELVDAVMDTVGATTLESSLSALRAGGRLVLAGASSGAITEFDISAIFLRSLSVLGSAMGSPDDLHRLADFVATREIVPAIDSIWDLDNGLQALERARSGDAFGKVVIRCS